MIIEQKKVPCLKNEKVLYLQDLDVSEEMRSQGVGAKLIDACKNSDNLLLRSSSRSSRHGLTEKHTFSHILNPSA